MAQIIVSSILIYFAIALLLVFTQWPGEIADSETIDFSGQATTIRDTPAHLETYIARDGATLGVRKYHARKEGAPLLVLIHGSGWHGEAYDMLAKRIFGQGEIDVLVPDLRGHGAYPVVRGDVSYVGQLEDDVFDLIERHRKQGQKVILAGHSSGGGLAIRFAGGRYGASLDKVVLLSPFLKYDAATMRENSGGWARPLTRRIIGLSMLNMVGIRGLNGMTAIQFNFPKSVLESDAGALATAQYSFRMNSSYAPRQDYLGDVKSLPNFLLVAGREDEAFKAEEFEPVLSSVNPLGEYILLDKVSHLGIINKVQTADIIRNFVLN